jgi:hypothetical protein
MMSVGSRTHTRLGQSLCLVHAGTATLLSDPWPLPSVGSPPSKLSPGTQIPSCRAQRSPSAQSWSWVHVFERVGTRKQPVMLATSKMHGSQLRIKVAVRARSRGPRFEPVPRPADRDAGVRPRRRSRLPRGVRVDPAHAAEDVAAGADRGRARLRGGLGGRRSATRRSPGDRRTSSGSTDGARCARPRMFRGTVCQGREWMSVEC